MPGKLLTIAIPTFTRARHLALLLDVLSEELIGLEEYIEVLIFDNASEDDTSTVTSQFAEKHPSCKVVRHLHNIGSAPNFLACFEAATSQYFWMFGDDDAPARGLLSKVVELLKTKSLDMVYIDSHWETDITPLVRREPSPLKSRVVPREVFAKRTHVFLTFITSVIIDKTLLKQRVDIPDLCHRMGRHFSQLAWTLNALKLGNRFAVIEGNGILATKANSGGYAAVTVFGSEFPSAVETVLGKSKEARIILRRALICYLPGLVWAVRNSTAGRFDSKISWTLIQRHFGKSLWYWGALIPISYLPKYMAIGFLFLVRVAALLLRKWDRLGYRLWVVE